MRAFLILLFTLGLLRPVLADDSGAVAIPPAAKSATKPAPASGKVIKVLPLWLDLQGRAATSPSLFDRDAYQAHLRDNTNEVSAVRYDVLWSAKTKGEKLTLRAELRSVGDAGVPRLKTLEAEVTAGAFRKWTSLTLEGDEFQKFGAVVAWRVTLWRGSELIGSEHSFLW